MYTRLGACIRDFLVRNGYESEKLYVFATTCFAVLSLFSGGVGVYVIFVCVYVIWVRVYVIFWVCVYVIFWVRVYAIGCVYT